MRVATVAGGGLGGVLFPEQFADGGDKQGIARCRLGCGEEEVFLAFDQAGVEVGAGKGRAGDEARQEVDIGGQAGDLVIGQRIAGILRRDGHSPRRAAVLT